MSSFSSTATAVKTFTLEVPANNQAILSLMWRIMNEAENGDERINLNVGTCELLCEDEREREEHRNNVTANYAIQTLEDLLPGEPEPTIEEATMIVKEVQDEFMRGELDKDMIRRLNAEFPQAIPDWNKMKLKLTIQLNNFRKRAKNIRVQSHKSGKVYKKKRRKNLYKLETQYKKSGCEVILSWDAFYAETML
jgi:hypothetical protein